MPIVKVIAPNITQITFDDMADVPVCEYAHENQPNQVAAVTIEHSPDVFRHLCMRCFCMITAEVMGKGIIVNDY